MTPTHKTLARTLAVLLLAVGATTHAAAEPSEVEALRTGFKGGMEQINQAHTAALQKASDDYRVFIYAEEAKARQAGDLDAVLALRAEQKRMERELTIPGAPAADAYATVAAGQTTFNAALKEANANKQTQAKELGARHVERLDELTRELTRGDDLNAALAARAASVAIRDELKRNGIEAAPPAVMQACPKCGGSGQRDILCSNCQGTGTCPRCNGRGTVASQLKGSRTQGICMTCRRTGICDKCNDGKIEGKQVCDACGGKGWVPVPEVQPETQPPASSTPQVPAWATVPSSERGDYSNDEVGRYQKAVDELTRRFVNEKPEAVDFGSVVANQDAYTGRLLVSSVYLALGHPRYVRVSATPTRGGDQEGTQLLPRDISIGIRSAGIYNKGGPNGRCVIIYGVINKTSFSLFDIRTATDGE